MSLSVEEWKGGSGEPDDSGLLAEIERKPYKAYEFADLMPKKINLVLAIALTYTLQEGLNRLIKKGLIKSKNIRGKTFYISSKAL